MSRRTRFAPPRRRRPAAVAGDILEAESMQILHKIEQHQLLPTADMWTLDSISRGLWQSDYTLWFEREYTTNRLAVGGGGFY